MAPHHALIISEILSLILENLGIHSYGSRRNLLSAALCCKAFKDLSLDVLWYTMTGITPILKLIPGMERVDGKMVLFSNDTQCSSMIKLIVNPTVRSWRARSQSINRFQLLRQPSQMYSCFRLQLRLSCYRTSDTCSAVTTGERLTSILEVV
jgi:hypothetical protein